MSHMVDLVLRLFILTPYNALCIWFQYMARVQCLIAFIFTSHLMYSVLTTWIVTLITIWMSSLVNYITSCLLMSLFFQPLSDRLHPLRDSPWTLPHSSLPSHPRCCPPSPSQMLLFLLIPGVSFFPQSWSFFFLPLPIPLLPLPISLATAFSLRQPCWGPYGTSWMPFVSSTYLTTSATSIFTHLQCLPLWFDSLGKFDRYHNMPEEHNVSSSLCFTPISQSHRQNCSLDIGGISIRRGVGIICVLCSEHCTLLAPRWLVLSPMHTHIDAGLTQRDMMDRREIMQTSSARVLNPYTLPCRTPKKLIYMSNPLQEADLYVHPLWLVCKT